MKGRMSILISLVMIMIPLSTVIPSFIITAESQSEIQFPNSPIVEGYVDGDFGTNGWATLGFYGKFPSKWNSTTLISLESSLSFHDQTVSRNAYFRLDFEVDIFNTDEILVFHDSLLIWAIKNPGNEFLDQLINKGWNLNSTRTGISAGEIWTGIVYMTGTVTLNSLTYSNSSSTWNVTYVTDNNVSFSSLGFTSWISISGILLVVILFSHQSLKRED